MDRRRGYIAVIGAYDIDFWHNQSHGMAAARDWPARAEPSDRNGDRTIGYYSLYYRITLRAEWRCSRLLKRYDAMAGSPCYLVRA